MVLSVFDLVVGVSNDAANFLNSAVGSKAASRRTIVIVAAIGVLLGALFSSGMMEIAKSGVFMPAEFTFHDIMLIFLAVMLTDVILLDVFNTFGLPTSTTVSIVFELLGGAVALALYKIWIEEPGAAQELSQYINTANALKIVSGILSSVVIAFSTGLVVMWISRLIFSFNYKKSFKFLGALWCGIALTAITYFAIFKGLKGSPIVSKEFMDELNANIWFYVWLSFGGWTVLMWVLQTFLNVNILKVSVLAGTMALALAFAGNDLVNFIGVFIAGSESLTLAENYLAAGGDLSSLKMGGLLDPSVADWRYLLAAGMVMILALYFSKKAQTVTETEVNLARSGGGAERFGSVPPARIAVRYALQLGRVVEMVLPQKLATFIESRFKPLEEKDASGASFDLIRASVNLTVAALLISLATSLKLPLSTTYVTFMVAMGSSLADKAWGRDSAVYRITGVFTVITGWFFTAFAAFTMCFIVANCLAYGGLVGIVAMVALVVFLLIKSTSVYRKRNREMAKIRKEEYSHTEAVSKHSEEVVALMTRMSEIYTSTLESLNVEDRRRLKKLRKEANRIRRELSDKMDSEVVPIVQTLANEDADRGKRYMQMIDFSTSVYESLSNIVSASFTYIDNNHEGLSLERVETLRTMKRGVSGLYLDFTTMVTTHDFSKLDEAVKTLDSLDEECAEILKKEFVLNGDDLGDMRQTLLYLNLLNETRTMSRKVLLLAKVHKQFVLGN